MKFTPEQVEQNGRDLFTSMAIPGIAEGYKDPNSGIEDELEKMVFDADPSMPQKIADFKSGNIASLNKQIVYIVLEKK